MFRLFILIFSLLQILLVFCQKCIVDPTDNKNITSALCVKRADCNSETKQLCRDGWKVCCASTDINPRIQIPTFPQYCGYAPTNDIAHGSPILSNQYEWVASLEYDYARESIGICAGSVISKYYMITAAHCLVGEILQKYGLVNAVRFGSEEIDCDYADCLPYQRYTVNERIVHPEYKKDEFKVALNDIALLKLDQEVQYTPICLPFDNVQLLNISFIATGWNNSAQLNYRRERRAAVLQILPDAECIQNNATMEYHICARGDDTVNMCEGDAGGPLMRSLGPYRILEGIITQGFLGCSSNSSISTRVRNYLPWIEQTVDLLWPY